MHDGFPSVSTRTAEFSPRELRLLKPRQDPPPRTLRIRIPSPGIAERVRRWLEEEL